MAARVRSTKAEVMLHPKLAAVIALALTATLVATFLIPPPAASAQAVQAAFYLSAANSARTLLTHSVSIGGRRSPAKRQ
jgi:hypothetical protein